MSKLIAGALFCGIVLAGCQTPNQMSANASARRDADYNAAVRKCDALGDAERSQCLYDARTRYGKS